MIVGIRVIASALALLISGCGAIDVQKSFYAHFAEATGGPTARIRVVTDGMVRAIPGSTCVDWKVEGAGVTASTSGIGVNLNGRKLDMAPGRAQVLAQGSYFATSELSIAAEQPIVLTYLGFFDRDQCFVSSSFVPKAGNSYEAVLWVDRKRCKVQLSDITEGVEGVPVKQTYANFC